MDKNNYQTRNTNIASYLAASGLPLLGTIRKNNVVYFEFTSKKEAKKLLSQYFSNQALVNPRELFSWLDSFRDLIFSTGKGVSKDG